MDLVVATDQHRELGEFLRSRRERRRPQDVGLPAGGRRRTPGLRREEVALLAGLSVTWYTWLEQGRDVHASRQVLAGLVDTLGLDEVETAHLFRLSGEVPPRERESAAQVVADHYQALMDQLDPNPAFLLDHRFDVVAWNRGAEVLYPDLPRVDPARRNILWLTFTSDELRAASPDWESEAAQTVAFFRAQVGRDVTDPHIAELLADLQAASDTFTRLWNRKDLAALAGHDRTVHHRKLGDVTFTLSKMRTLDDRHTLVAYLAPDGSDLAQQLAELADDA
jgi:transcriptional regulator with XRE-family HTH domain